MRIDICLLISSVIAGIFGYYISEKFEDEEKSVIKRVIFSFSVVFTIFSQVFIIVYWIYNLIIKNGNYILGCLITGGILFILTEIIEDYKIEGRLSESIKIIGFIDAVVLISMGLIGGFFV